MGVLAKLFRRSESSQGAKQQSGAGWSEKAARSVIESKPVPNASGTSQPDQAARLREAVLSVERDKAEDSGEIDLDSSLSDAVESPAPQTEADSSIDESGVSSGFGPDESSSDNATLTRKPRAPRSKQEMVEELHRNYQEVLGLIRKLDAHLDEARGRSETITGVAEQYSQLAPVLESLPDHLTREANQLRGDLRESINTQGTAARELLERIESAIVHVGTDIERSTNQQGQLVQTMAEFRESLIDLSRASTAACESVRDSETRAATRDEALLSQLRQTRLWLIGLTVGVGAIGVTAVIIGIVALSR